MRIDVVSIFPDYFAPLDLSLPGKARRSGLLDLHVHDLRSWTHDRHRTVDDTPYGGGPGMVMKPQPWGEALDDISGTVTDGSPVLVVPTPSGERFTQQLADQLAGEPWLLVACGRYEGIDDRVVEHARTRMQVREVSVGDYVLNGGEAAALAIIEAVARLLPGFMGNPESLAEESHGTDRLLEYPVYTKPPSWRGLDVPEVLLTGDHAKVAAWRHAQAVRRTAERRPDLLHPSQRLALPGLPGPEAEVRLAGPADVPEMHTLRRACLLDQAQATDTLDIPALREGLTDTARWVESSTVVLVRAGGRLAGCAPARLETSPEAAGGGSWVVGPVLVVPDLRDHGLDRWLVAHLEALAPVDAARIELVVGAGDLRAYRKAGFRPAASRSPGELRLVKTRR